MSNQRSAIWSGGLLIVIGALFLAINLLEIDWRKLWPLLVFAGAAVNFAIFIADRRNYGVLMPATILLIYGALFQYCVLEGWWHMSELWPTFILGPGAGLLMMYLFGKRDTGLLIPSLVLIGLSAIFFVTLGPLRDYGQYWPVLLIIVGLLLLLKRQK
ncbi:MAG: hypothetical protein ONB44_16810 [candidate division KSB1 bacterium]|nr:hypothetical protein [candidate division KSB1 bacterium]MDZ7303797.1 hypothetical protein [candidate division KSB1 bacterium]MDZ7313056.1 hypothetical protein [candidate division KSB1 bacterium]